MTGLGVPDEAAMRGRSGGFFAAAAGRLVNFLAKGYDQDLVESVGMLTTGAG
jgi:hypothetical protein